MEEIPETPPMSEYQAPTKKAKPQEESADIYDFPESPSCEPPSFKEVVRRTGLRSQAAAAAAGGDGRRRVVSKEL
jgi:hypothetical protein